MRSCLKTSQSLRVCLGVIKTYRLTYEPAEVMHALFDKNSANNRWTIQSNMLKEYIDYFGTRTEHLDIYNEDDRVTFTSYTEKIVNGKGMPIPCIANLQDIN